MGRQSDRFTWVAGPLGSTLDVEKALRRLELDLKNYVTSVEYMSADMSGDQSTNLTAGNHVEFDTELESSDGVELATGSGQADGIFTLAPGVYMLSISSLVVNFSAITGSLSLRFRDGDGTQLGAGPALLKPPGSTALQAGNGYTSAIFVSTSSVNTVELRIEAATDVTSIAASTGITITEL